MRQKTSALAFWGFAAVVVSACEPPAGNGAGSGAPSSPDVSVPAADPTWYYGREPEDNDTGEDNDELELEEEQSAVLPVAWDPELEMGTAPTFDPGGPTDDALAGQSLGDPPDIPLICTDGGSGGDDGGSDGGSGDDGGSGNDSGSGDDGGSGNDSGADAGVDAGGGFDAPDEVGDDASLIDAGPDASPDADAGAAPDADFDAEPDADFDADSDSDAAAPPDATMDDAS